MPTIYEVRPEEGQSGFLASTYREALKYFNALIKDGCEPTIYHYSYENTRESICQLIDKVRPVSDE